MRYLRLPTHGETDNRREALFSPKRWPKCMVEKGGDIVVYRVEGSHTESGEEV